MKQSLERLCLGMENSSASQKPLTLNHQYLSEAGERNCERRELHVRGNNRLYSPFAGTG